MNDRKRKEEEEKKKDEEKNMEEKKRKNASWENYFIYESFQPVSQTGRKAVRFNITI